MNPMIAVLIALLCFSQEAISDNCAPSNLKRLSDVPAEYYPEPWARPEQQPINLQIVWKQMKPPETWIILTVAASVVVMLILLRFFIPRT